MTSCWRFARSTDIYPNNILDIIKNVKQGNPAIIKTVPVKKEDIDDASEIDP
jgi:hypothetical protein